MTDHTPEQTGSDSERPHRRISGEKLQRYLAVTAFVGLWMAAGWLLHLEIDQYLLLGVPLTILFQIFVRREPLHALWVRDAPPLRITLSWLLMTAALAALPLYKLYQAALERDWVLVGWRLCAVLGAPAAAYALQNWNPRVSRAVLPSAMIVLVYSALMALAVLGLVIEKELGAAAVLDRSGNAALVFLRSSLLYFPVGFFLEEVAFRGALDSHVHPPDGKRGYASAILISVLWGLWHMPIAPGDLPLPLMILFMVLLHGVVGALLSRSWRIGGNLAVPAAAHALLDGVRNAFLSIT